MPGKFLPFEIFKQGAAAGGNIADLVGIAELVDRRDGVAAADEGEGAVLGRFGDGLCDASCAVLELRHFKNAHRPVPEDGL